MRTDGGFFVKEGITIADDLAIIEPEGGLVGSDDYGMIITDADGNPVDDVYIAPANCTVTFDSDGGSEVEAQTVKNGEKAAKPADSTKDSFVFAGWQLNGEDYDFSDPVIKHITLKATWTEEEPEPETEPAVPKSGDATSWGMIAGIAVIGAAAVALSTAARRSKQS